MARLHCGLFFFLRRLLSSIVPWTGPGPLRWMQCKQIPMLHTHNWHRHAFSWPFESAHLAEHSKGPLTSTILQIITMNKPKLLFVRKPIRMTLAKQTQYVCAQKTTKTCLNLLIQRAAPRSFVPWINAQVANRSQIIANSCNAFVYLTIVTNGTTA